MDNILLVVEYNNNRSLMGENKTIESLAKEDQEVQKIKKKTYLQTIFRIKQISTQYLRNYYNIELVRR